VDPGRKGRFLFVPRASRGTRLLIASLIWTSVGIGLLVTGLHWLLAHTSPLWIAAIPLAALLGAMKGNLVLRPRADANAQRILDSPDTLCIGGAFSWSSWGIALSMMLMGVLLRRSALPRTWLGLIYTAAGAALLTASAGSWKCWLRARSPVSI
jgi:hypothetical protein